MLLIPPHTDSQESTAAAALEGQNGRRGEDPGFNGHVSLPVVTFHGFTALCHHVTRRTSHTEPQMLTWFLSPSPQGRICRKAGKSKKSFSRKEAEATFKSLVKTHEKYGWVTPPVSDG